METPIAPFPEHELALIHWLRGLCHSLPREIAARFFLIHEMSAEGNAHQDAASKDARARSPWLDSLQSDEVSCCACIVPAFADAVSEGAGHPE